MCKFRLFKRHKALFSFFSPAQAYWFNPRLDEQHGEDIQYIERAGKVFALSIVNGCPVDLNAHPFVYRFLAHEAFSPSEWPEWLRGLSSSEHSDPWQLQALRRGFESVLPCSVLRPLRFCGEDMKTLLSSRLTTEDPLNDFSFEQVFFLNFDVKPKESKAFIDCVKAVLSSLTPSEKR
jgi:hypothetical protein